MALLKVIIPGPWWHELSYESDKAEKIGVRLLVPMGRSERIGLCTGVEYGACEGVSLRKVIKSLDPEPVIPESYLEAAKITAGAFLCSTGEVLNSILPSAFWRGDKFPAFKAYPQKKNENKVEFYYELDDAERCRVYQDAVLKANKGALVVFPERQVAKNFYRSLVGVIPKDRLFFWPNSGGQTVLRYWKAVLASEMPVVVGTLSACAAPVRDSSLCILDDESNVLWRAKNYPHISLRSFSAARSRVSGGSLLLGGRLPSSRVYQGFSPQEHPVSLKKTTLRLLDLKSVSRLGFKGIKFPLPVADILLSETVNLVSDNKIVFWLLDRRGVSGELHCADCGQSLSCSRCGSTFSLEKGQLRCSVCGQKAAVPLRCPSCGGRVLEGSSPGLEALLPMAKNLLSDKPVVIWHGEDPANLTEAKARVSLLKKEGGLLIGSRRALSLLDSLHTDLIAWLDADAEARQPHYTSRFTAYSMLLESLFRGGHNRVVLLQSRNFSQPWLRGLQLGWTYFWNEELRERANFDFPPNSHLVEIEPPSSWKWREDLVRSLDEAGFYTLLSEGSSKKFTVLTPRMAHLRHFLEKYFSIKRSRFGFPKITVWSD